MTRNAATVTVTHTDPAHDASLCERCFEARRREDILARFGAAVAWPPVSTWDKSTGQSSPDGGVGAQEDTVLIQ